MRKFAAITLFMGIIATFSFVGRPVAQSANAQREQHSPSNLFEQILLNQHNMERDMIGVRKLVWNDVLEEEARQWAKKLAREGSMYHSTYKGRNTTGENLWMGTEGRYRPEEMINSFLAERDYFLPGKFPNVTNTDNWEDVGHYTQIIWAQTKEVGCALESGKGWDFLVCRYWPSGNMTGVRVG